MTDSKARKSRRASRAQGPFLACLTNRRWLEPGLTDRPHSMEPVKPNKLVGEPAELYGLTWVMKEKDRHAGASSLRVVGSAKLAKARCAILGCAARALRKSQTDARAF